MYLTYPVCPILSKCLRSTLWIKGIIEQLSGVTSHGAAGHSSQISSQVTMGMTSFLPHILQVASGQGFCFYIVSKKDLRLF